MDTGKCTSNLLDSLILPGSLLYQYSHLTNVIFFPRPRTHRIGLRGAARRPLESDEDCTIRLAPVMVHHTRSGASAQSVSRVINLRQKTPGSEHLACLLRAVPKQLVFQSGHHIFDQSIFVCCNFCETFCICQSFQTY